MILPDPGFRCAAASLLRDEPLAGTASTVRAFVLLEHAGPWGVNALRDARLPHDLGARLRRTAAATGVRVLLVRRPGRPPARHHTAVFAAYAHPHRPWLERGELYEKDDVLDLDFEGLAAGDSAGLERHADNVYGVCTHGRHDACCAERGRPVAAALSAGHPEDTWEVSHIGGDRFSGNLLVLPHGLYYGRLDAPAAVAVAGEHEAGHLDLDHLRGRSGYAMPVQAAEIALRRELGETRNDALRLTHRAREGAETVAEFGVGGGFWAVRVQTSSGETTRLTCQATRENPVPVHQVTSITRVDGQPPG
jgi:hypothetical protein